MVSRAQKGCKFNLGDVELKNLWDQNKEVWVGSEFYE